MNIKSRFIISLVTVLALTTAAKAADAPVVMELFTSQSCSSCPPANAELKKLVESDPSLIALSFHVNYWDYLSWKDTYSSQSYSDRQSGYTEMRGGSGDFTPELVVDGAASMNGADAGRVKEAIEAAKKTLPQFSVAITPKNGQLQVSLQPKAVSHTAFEVWEVYYDHDSIVHIKAGENGGRTLETINNVTSIKKLEGLSATSPVMIEPPKDYAVAILVQAAGQGKILGAASYIKR